MRWSPKKPQDLRPRGTVHVAACVIRDQDGRILLAQRRADQLSGGYWEVPGGKIEPGETPKAAAARELFEETGLSATRLKRFSAYSHQFATGRVSLDVFLADDWAGTPKGQENQRLAWVDPACPQVAPLLPSNQKILTLLTLPKQVLCVTAQSTRNPDWVDTSLNAANEIGAGALMLTGPMTDAQRVSLTRRLNPQAQARGLTIWQSGVSAQSAPIRILSAPATVAQPIISSEIVGVIAKTLASTSVGPSLQGDILVIPNYNDPARMEKEIKAFTQSLATPVYAVVTADLSQQRAALSAGAAGLLIDEQKSLSEPKRFKPFWREAELAC